MPRDIAQAQGAGFAVFRAGRGKITRLPDARGESDIVKKGKT